MLHTLGWNLSPDNDAEYFEPRGIRDCNEVLLATGKLPSGAQSLIDRLHRPWVIKDPRFMATLPEWSEILLPHEPMLLWIVRDVKAVEMSYVRRGETVDGITSTRGYKIDAAIERCGLLFDSWPGPKLRVEYEAIGEASGLWNQRDSGPAA